MTAQTDGVQGDIIEHTIHVVASPFKTGSSSVGKALLALGVGTREMPYSRKDLKGNRAAIRAANALVVSGVGFRAFREQHETFVIETLQPLVAAVSPYDVFHDAPFGHAHIHPFVRKILAPKAKFIWVERDTEEWLESVRKWEQGHPEIYRKHEQWTSAPKVARKRRMKTLKEAQSGFRRIQKFAPRDCLVLRWSDLQSYDALAAFYDVTPPETAFPKVNVSQS